MSISRTTSRLQILLIETRQGRLFRLEPWPGESSGAKLHTQVGQKQIILPYSIYSPLSSMTCLTRRSLLHRIDKGSKLQTGDRRLLVRTLPLQRSAKDVKTRADCHMWPKGTFLEMKRGHFEQVLSSNIVQRSQQSHAPSEWKGMSEPVSWNEQPR